MLSSIILFLALCLFSFSIIKIINYVLLAVKTGEDKSIGHYSVVLIISFGLFSYLFYLLH